MAAKCCIIRLQCVDEACCYICYTVCVCLSVCVWHTRVSFAKTAEPILSPFGELTHVGPRSRVLDRSRTLVGRGSFEGDMYWFILTYLRIVRLPSNADKYIRLREQLLVTSPAGAVAKYYDEHVCLCVCVCVYLSARISWESHVRSLSNFLCMLPMAVAWSYSDEVTKSEGKE